LIGQPSLSPKYFSIKISKIFNAVIGGVGCFFILENLKQFEVSVAKKNINGILRLRLKSRDTAFEVIAFV
jgi:hypothetical protein